MSDTLAKILEREPDYTALPPSTPPRVRELIQRCLVKDAKLRLRDMGDARIVLDEVLASRLLSGQLPLAETSAVLVPRRRTQTVAIAIAAVMGLAIGAVLWGAFAPGKHTAAGAKPVCLAVAMPADVKVLGGDMSPTGGAMVVLGRPRLPDGTVSLKGRLYVRRADSYEYKELPGSEGAQFSIPSIDGRSVVFLAPSAPGSPDLRILRVPMDGSVPATTIGEWKDSWRWLGSLHNGDLIILDGAKSFVRIPKSGGAPTAPITMDAGLPGVSR